MDALCLPIFKKKIAMKLPTTTFTNLAALHNNNVSTAAPAPADLSSYIHNDHHDHNLYDSDTHWDNTSDYVYDYDESVNTLPVEELVVNAVGYGLVLLLGMVGNILVVISVARYRRMHNVTNIFLLSLATADLLLVCICIPVKVSVLPGVRTCDISITKVSEALPIELSLCCLYLSK